MVCGGGGSPQQFKHRKSSSGSVSFAKQKKRNKVQIASLHLHLFKLKCFYTFSVLVFRSAKIKDNEKEETKLQAKRKASVRSAAPTHSTHGMRE